MSIFNIINWKKQSAIKAYAFVSSIFGKNFTNNNISVFKDQNIIQMSINKINF